jgi:tetratricopeptide (TPR) repeat protein
MVLARVIDRGAAALTEQCQPAQGIELPMDSVFNAVRAGRPTARRAWPLLLALALVPNAIAQTPQAPATAPAPAAPKAPEPCLRGRDLYRQGKPDAARTALLECLGVQGDRVEILIPLAVIALQANDVVQALRFADRAVVAGPEDPEALYWDGRALMANGRTDDARARWEAGLQIDTGHMGILEGLARLSLAKGDATHAYQFLMQMRQRGMDAPWLHRLLADITAGRGLWEQALAHLNDALVLEPNDAGDWLTASELAIMVGKQDKAVEYSRQAVNLKRDAAGLGGLGQAFFSADEIDSALVYLRQAVAVGGGKPRIRFNLANVLEISGHADEAGVQFKQFLKEEPKDAVGHFNYAIHLQKQGRLEEALSEADLAAGLEPSMTTADVVRIQILEDLERWEAAIQGINRLKAKDPRGQAELAAWEQRIRERQGAAAQAGQDVRAAEAAGKVHLLHIVLDDRRLLAKVTSELANGMDFGTLAVQFSKDPAAARGGDIGWINPDEMVEPLRSAIVKLKASETSPPIESMGLIHLFKRVP